MVAIQKSFFSEEEKSLIRIENAYPNMVTYIEEHFIACTYSSTFALYSQLLYVMLQNKTANHKTNPMLFVNFISMSLHTISIRSSL